VTTEAKLESNKEFLAYMKAKYLSGNDNYVPTNLSQERFARPCVPMAMSRIPDGMMCQVTKVGRLTEFNTQTTTSTTVRTKESTFHSSMSVDSYSHTRSSYLEFTESRRVVATMHNGAPMLGPGQGASHKQLTDTVQGQVANNIHQSEVVIKQKKSFLHENWSQFRRCVDGTHFGAVMFDAACTGRAYHERHFVDGSMTGQAQARLIVRTPIVCCIACGVTTTLLYKPDPSKFGRNWQWNKVSGGISRGMKCDWVPTIENIATDAEAARSPNRLLGSILTMGTAPGRLFTDAQLQQLFPRHSAVAGTRGVAGQVDSCDRGDHVFGACTYSTRSQSRVQTVLESRQEFHSYSKSSSFSIGVASYNNLRGSAQQSGFTRFAAVCSAGSLTVAVHKCLFCNASKTDPTDELELVATENAQDLIIRLLPPGFDIKEGFASPIVMNLARECSMGSLPPQQQRNGAPQQPTGTTVGGGEAQAEKSGDLPTLIEFLDAIPDTSISSADKLAIFAALHERGYFLALLARMAELDVLELGERIPSVRDEVWFEFVQRVAALGYCGTQSEE
jgi:hypothetical protein